MVSVGQHHCRSLQGAHGLLRAFPAGVERAARLLDQRRLRLRGELAGGQFLTSEITVWTCCPVSPVAAPGQQTVHPRHIALEGRGRLLGVTPIARARLAQW